MKMTFRSAAVWVTLATAMIVAWAGSREAFTQARTPDQQASAYPADVYPDSRARIPKVKRADLLTDDERQAFDRMVTDGEIPTNATGVRLHVPIVAEHYRDANYWIRDKSGLEPVWVELACLVGAREGRGEYEWIAHEGRGLKAGLSQQVIDALKLDKDVAGLPEKEAAVIRLGREMHREPKVSAKTFADVERLFGRRRTLSIALLIVHYSASAMLLRTYDSHLAPGQESPFPAR